GPAVTAHREVSLDTRPAERRERARDALRLHRVGRVGVSALPGTVGPMVEPCAVRIALEPIELSLVGDLDCPELADRHRQQPARVGTVRATRLRPKTVRPFERPDARSEGSQQHPDGDEPGSPWDWAQCCFHHTAVPTIARTAGTRSTDRKNTA